MFINKLFSSSNSYYYPLSGHIQTPNKLARVIAYIACGILVAVAFYNICSSLFWESRFVGQKDSPKSLETSESPKAPISESPETPESDQSPQKGESYKKVFVFDDESVDDLLGVGPNSPPSDPNEEFIIRSVDWNKIKVPRRERNYSEAEDSSYSPSSDHTPLYSKTKKVSAKP